MTLTSLLGIAVLALWAVAMPIYALRVPKAHALLRRFNYFRQFARWTMFSVGRHQTARPRSYRIEKRPIPFPGEPGEWTLVSSGCHWVPWGWIADPSRHLHGRIHALASMIERCTQSESRDADAERTRCEKLLMHYFGNGARGLREEFRIVVCHHMPGHPPDRVVCEFSGTTHDGTG